MTTLMLSQVISTLLTIAHAFIVAESQSEVSALLNADDKVVCGRIPNGIGLTQHESNGPLGVSRMLLRRC